MVMTLKIFKLIWLSTAIIFAGLFILFFSQSIGVFIYNCMLRMGLVQLTQAFNPVQRGYGIASASPVFIGWFLVFGGVIRLLGNIFSANKKVDGQAGISRVKTATAVVILFLLSVLISTGGIVIFLRDTGYVQADLMIPESKQIYLEEGSYSMYHQIFSADTGWIDSMTFVSPIFDVDIKYNGVSIPLNFIHPRKVYQTLSSSEISLFDFEVNNSDYYLVKITTDKVQDTAYMGQILIKTKPSLEAVSILIICVTVGLVIIILTGYILVNYKKRKNKVQPGK